MGAREDLDRTGRTRPAITDILERWAAGIETHAMLVTGVDGLAAERRRGLIAELLRRGWLRSQMALHLGIPQRFLEATGSSAPKTALPSAPKHPSGTMLRVSAQEVREQQRSTGVSAVTPGRSSTPNVAPERPTEASAPKVLTLVPSPVAKAAQELREAIEEESGEEPLEAVAASPAPAGAASGSARRGFAVIDAERRREIARRGGLAVQASGLAHKFTSEEAQAAGRKGGRGRPSKPEPVEPSSETRLVTIDDVVRKHVEPDPARPLGAEIAIAEERGTDAVAKVIRQNADARSQAAEEFRQLAAKWKGQRFAPELMGVFDEIDALGLYLPGGRRAAAE